MKYFKIILFLSFSLLTPPSYSTPLELELLWENEAFKNPESIVYDANQNLGFVSNQNLSGKKGAASIGKLNLDGSTLEAEWVKGLNEPKGMVIIQNRLFVSDVTEVVEIDIQQSKIIKRYPAQGAKFLNDIASDSAGNIYVSDMFTSSIYRLGQSGTLQLWMQSPMLENPNGLYIEDGVLYIAAWGTFNDAKPLSAPAGHVLKVALKNQKIEKLSKKAIGNLDGIQRFTEMSFLVSDWVTGKIFQLKSDFSTTELLDLEQSSGDIAYIKEKKLLLIPMAQQNKVLAYKIK